MNRSSKPTVERKVICVIGATGTGKSQFCRLLAGSADSELFPVSKSITSCTYLTTVQTVKLFGNFEEVDVIDTPGLGDSEGRDTQHIAEMVEKLKSVTESHGGVNVFLIVFNGQNPRMDQHLKAMIKIFNSIFSSKFLCNVALVFTRWAYDKRSIKQRTKAGESEARRSSEFTGYFRREFGYTGEDLACFFVDSLYDTEDADESRLTDAQLLRLAGHCKDLDKFPCQDIEAVKGEIDQLNDKISEEKIRVVEERTKRAEEKEQHAEETRKAETKRTEEVQKANHRDAIAQEKLRNQQKLVKIEEEQRKGSEKRTEEDRKRADKQSEEDKKSSDKRDKRAEEDRKAADKRTNDLIQKNEELSKRPPQVVYRRRSSSGGCCVM